MNDAQLKRANEIKKTLSEADNVIASIDVDHLSRVGFDKWFLKEFHRP